jgi:hypothetical protein
MIVHRAWRARIVGSLIALLCVARPADSQQYMTRHWSGQGVAPVYEGFDTNPDGTYNMWFGYMNRNFEEEPDLVIGPDNTFEPGGDRGQPTHFATRRHKDVFKVTVPKSFRNQRLVWKLTVRGKSESVAGTLNPIWQIDRLRTTRGGTDEAVDSNTPPIVKVTSDTQSVDISAAAALHVSATDDGLPKNRGIIGQASDENSGRRPRGPAGLSFEWVKYRGPGKVTFNPPIGMMAAGKVTSTARFSAPGEYVLQVQIDDGSGESAGNFGYHCCWTNAEVKVMVTGVAAEQK